MINTKTRNADWNDFNAISLRVASPEKIKEWRHTAYLNRKEKLKQSNEEI